MNTLKHLPALLLGMLFLVALPSCDRPFTTEPSNTITPQEPLQATTPAITRMRGAGTLGDGHEIGDGVWRQYFDFNVGIDNGVVDGVLVYVDSAVIKEEDGEPAELRVSSTYPGTAILSFVQTSETCVEFDGTGYLINTGELLAFTAEACDNGVDVDFFGLEVPQRFVTHGQSYHRADLISAGDIIATLLGVGDTGITQMTGTGTLGLGEPTGEGIWLQEFSVDVGVHNGIAGGSIDYTDHSILVNGVPPHFRAALDEEGTAVTNFVQVSDTCVDFSGVGKLVNTGELLRFRARACDNGSPGIDLDVFGLWVPDHDYQRGPDLLSDGDLVSGTLS